MDKKSDTGQANIHGVRGACSVPPVQDEGEEPLADCGAGPDQGGRPLFYWELDATERAQLRASNTILEDEGYLAHDINRGRQLVALPEPYVAVPDVDPAWETPTASERFSDAIAAILQAGAAAGLDVHDLVSAALWTQNATWAYSAGAIRRD